MAQSLEMGFLHLRYFGRVSRDGSVEGRVTEILVFRRGETTVGV